jgi:hypothetical protein
MGAFREFLLILASGLIGAVLGAGFGVLVGFVSPEFVDALTHPYPIHTPERVGMAMGMIGGLLVGATAMVAGRLVGAVQQWAARGRAGEGGCVEADAAPDRDRNSGFTRHEGSAGGLGK